jgi:flagellar biosynthesis anti-sigma factor FlgM
MKIDPNKPPESQAPKRSAQNAQNVQKAAGAEQKEKTAQVKNPAPADRVDISGRSKDVADIRSALQQIPETRDARVQEIKQSIDAGTYTVDPRKVAESILKSI